MKCLVIGLGKSGFASALALSEQNNDVTVLEEGKLSVDSHSKIAELEKNNIKVVFQLQNKPEDFDLIVPSPAVPYHHPLLNESKVKIISEIELGFDLNYKGKIVAVTGTNGKTTTVNMLDAIYKEAQKNHYVAGNIGNPYTELRDKDLSDKTLILELSSFQLHFIDVFRAQIAVILNITEDHIDWHKDFNSYLEDKKKLFMNQEKDDVAIINVDDKAASSLLAGIKSKTVKVSTKTNTDFCVIDGSLCHNGNHFLKVSDFPLPGEHNVVNALCASAAAYYDGISLEVCSSALRKYKGLPHRLEKAAEIDGKIFIDDSKSTNPDSMVKALESMDKPVILLAGGRNKDSGFTGIPLEKIKHLICFGEAAKDIASQIDAPEKDVSETLKKAVIKANEVSNDGDIILLSPGCASFDEFNSYKHRGQCFKKYVLELKN
jgi:UDP-N-acetylmuramoylalanine--D-glutamate ligase